MPISPLPGSIEETLEMLAKADYIGDRSLATVLFLALRMGRPLFLEGEAGVGKTEIAKVLSKALGRRLIRLQCYEGLDVSAAVYEWNYGAQMIAIRMAEATGEGDKERVEHDVFSERFLIKRPLLQALEPDPAGPPSLRIGFEWDEREAYAVRVWLPFAFAQLDVEGEPTLREVIRLLLDRHRAAGVHVYVEHADPRWVLGTGIARDLDSDDALGLVVAGTETWSGDTEQPDS